jgi:hypothetical protein
MRVNSCEFNVRGTHFRLRENPGLKDWRPSGQPLRFVKETDSKVLASDEFAVRVYDGDVFLGYVPRADDKEEHTVQEWMNLQLTNPKLRSTVLRMAALVGKQWIDVTNMETEAAGLTPVKELSIAVHCWLDGVDVGVCLSDVESAYLVDNRRFDRITHILSRLPYSPDGLMQWAVDNFVNKRKLRDVLAACELTEEIQERVLVLLIDYNVGMKNIKSEGTKLHMQIEEYLHSLSTDTPQAPPDGFNINVEKVVAVEDVCVNPALNIAGTTDAVLIIDGIKTVVEWKSGRRVKPRDLLQVAFHCVTRDVHRGMVVNAGNNWEQTILNKAEIEAFYAVLENLVKLIHQIDIVLPSPTRKR